MQHPFYSKIQAFEGLICHNMIDCIVINRSYRKESPVFMGLIAGGDSYNYFCYNHVSPSGFGVSGPLPDYKYKSHPSSMFGCRRVVVEYMPLIPW
jgi:hypothetical protein